MSKRVAICLFGQTRTYQAINESYKNLNENPHLEIDFFVSTWDDFEDKKPFDFFTTSEFMNPNIIDFRDNTDRAAYTIHRVNLLKTIHEVNNNFIYDYVVWTRSDILFEKQDLLTFLNKKANESKDYEINTHTEIINDAFGFPYLPTGYFFMGTSLSFDLFATGWKSYYKRNDKSHDVLKHGGHNFHAYVIDTLPFELVVADRHAREKIEYKLLSKKLEKREV